jgi:hypothetical protein
MSSFFIAVVLAVGIGVFIWTKVVRSSGNADPKQSVIISTIVAVIAFIILYSLFAWVLHIK